MTPLNVAKGALVVVGLVLFFLSVRTGQEVLRYSGIALVAIAWLLRFVPGPKTASTSSRHSSEGSP